MAEDFAVLDFALVGATPLAVARALAEAEAGAGDAEPRAVPRSLLARLLGRAEEKPAPGAVTALLVQPPGTLPEGVLAREMLDDMGFGGSDRQVRLSAPVGEAGLTLIELRERTDGAPSPRLAALSRALGDDEILAFRLSGGQHPGGEFGFVVYAGGKAVREVRITRSEADDLWETTARGVAHRIEAQAPPDAADPGGQISPARQAAMLAALGIDADALLVDRSGHRDVIELSTRPGGTAPDDLADSPPAADVESPPGADSQAAAAWEDEVTTLLVTAVSDALPDAEQVPWLDAMTADLEAGRTKAALERTQALLKRGTRPQPERDAAAQRLAQLFGLSG